MNILPILSFLILSTCFPLFAYGGTLREIELIDGSRILAEVVAMDGQVYRLRSEALGELEIPEYKVKAIRTSDTTPTQNQSASTPIDQGGTPLPAMVPSTASPALGGLQQSFAQDRAAMGKVLSLQDDPLVQSILHDPTTMQAIQAGDLGVLLNDPKIRALMSHPTVQELSNEYGQ